MNFSWLEHRRRLAARVALYSSMVLVGATAWLLVKALDRPLQHRKSEDWIKTDYTRVPEVQVFRRYVQIDTSEKTGSEIAGARYLESLLTAAGIPVQIEILGDRHANLYARLEGADPHPLVLHNHIDVAPVDPKEWFSPPFEARIDGPWMYARGGFDMKSVAIAQLLAMIDLKKSGQPLKRSVLFLATSSEERGSRLGVRWIIRQHPELVRSFWAVLTEGGAVEARARDEIKYWGTEFAQKRFADLWLCSPERAPLDALRKLLRERGYTETDLAVTPEVRAYLRSYAPSRDRSDYRELLMRPDDTIRDSSEFHQLPDYVKSMFRNEAVSFPVEADPGGGWRMLVKFHLLPGVELADVREKLLPRWMTWGLTAVLDEPPSARHGSPLDHPVYLAVQKTLDAHYPGAPAGPWFLPWSATDSRFFRAAGIPAYGFSPFLIMSTDTLQVDQANERFALPSFVEGVTVYRDLLRRLLL